MKFSTSDDRLSLVWVPNILLSTEKNIYNVCDVILKIGTDVKYMQVYKFYLSLLLMFVC